MSLKNRYTTELLIVLHNTMSHYSAQMICHKEILRGKTNNKKAKQKKISECAIKEEKREHKHLQLAKFQTKRTLSNNYKTSFDMISIGK